VPLSLLTEETVRVIQVSPVTLPSAILYVG
jgi:hypothetical protein